MGIQHRVIALAVLATAGSSYLAAQVGNTYYYNEITSLASPGVDGFNYPLISRNADRIVYTQTSAGTTTLYAMNTDGSGVTTLDSESTAQNNYHYLSISDDGTKALIWSTNKIRSVNTNGTGGLTLVTVDGNFGISEARLTGDGTKVIFANNSDDNLTTSGSTPFAAGIYEINPDGTNLHAIATETTIATYLGLTVGNIRGIGALNGTDVSSTGSQIVFRTSFAFSGEYLLAVNGDGTGIHTIFGPITSVFTTGISGDGTKIWYNCVFVSLAPNEIGVVPFAGGTRKALVTGIQNSGGGIATDLQLNSNGTKLLFGDDGEGRLINTDGSGIVPLFETTQGITGPLINQGFLTLTMDATGTNFAFTSPARNVFPVIDEIGFLTLNQGSTAADPSITNPSANPDFIVVNGGSSTMVSATVTAPTAIGAVSTELLVPASAATVSINNNQLGPGAGNVYSVSFQGGYDGQTGLRTVRIQAETTDAGGKRHGAAVDFSPFYIDSAVPPTQTITFGALNNVMIGVAPFTIGATASSGLSVSFASTTPSVCTVSGATVTIVAVGTCSITASQAGSANYQAAPNVVQSFTVNGLQAAQTIAFGALSNATVGAAPFTITATASSGLSVSFASTTLSVCTVSGVTVTILNAGTCSIAASQAGNASYLAAPNVTQSFSVVGSGPGVANTYYYNEITSLASPGVDSFNYPLTSRSANRIIYTQTSAGTTTLYAMNPDGSGVTTLDSESTTQNNYHYLSVSDDGTKALIWSTNKIRFVNTNGTGGLTLVTVDGPFGITEARLTGDGTKVIFANSSDDNLTTSGSTPFAAGIYEINPDSTNLHAIATETTIANYLGLAVGNIRGIGALGGMDVSSTGSQIVFRTSFAFSGEYLLAVNGDGTGIHTIFGPITSVFTTGISGDGTTIWYNGVFVSLAPNEIGVVPFTGGTRKALVTGIQNDNGGIATDLQLSSDGSKLLFGDDGMGRLINTDGSGIVPLFVTTQGITGPLINSGGSLFLTMDASATHFAFTAAARNVFPVIDEIGLLTLNTGATAADPSITNPSATPDYIVVNGNSSATIGATVTSPTAVGAVSNALLVPSSAATVSVNNSQLGAGAGNVYSVSFQGGYDGQTGVRTARIQAETTDAGGKRHGAAVDFSPFYIDAAAPATETISFGALGNVLLGAAPFAVSASASSGLPVTLGSSTVAVCGVSGSTVTILGAGTCSITASQSGSTSYQPATSVTRSFTVFVTQAAQTITFGSLNNVSLGTAPFTISATATSGLTVTFVSNTTSVCTVSGTTVTILAIGTCSITASQPGNSVYLAAPNVTQTFTVINIKPSEVGVFRQSFAWLLDANGNRMYDGTGAGLDYFYFNFVPAQTGDIPVVGDWSGSGTTKIGIYRPATGQWFLDYNGNGVFDAGDKTYSFGGIAGDKPVVGDWSGSGTSKIGIFRSGFFWLLDYNGDGTFDSGDQAFAYGGVGGDVPIVGDWTGNGITKVGVVRVFFPGGTPAFWILDANNDHSIDAGDLVFAFGGITGDVPVAGDWNGTGFAKAGMFRSGFFWVIDNNGSAPTVLGGSQVVAFGYGGVAGDIPVVGKW